MNGRKWGLVTLAFCLVFLTVCEGAAKVPEASLACLECHGKRGAIVKFQNNDWVSTYIDAKKYQYSVHRELACADCHYEFSSENHPKRQFKSREQYAVKSSQVCWRCHTEETLREKPQHETLFARQGASGPMACTHCHEPHAMKPARGGRVIRSDREYCMGCHQRDIRMAFADGGAMSVQVNVAQHQASVHGKLGCSDCHFGFSSEEHPKRNFRTRKDFTVALSESCRRCHFDKYTKTLESIHFSALSRGNMRAPVCVDCHGSHAILPVGRDRTASAKKCGTCHQAVYDTYAKSVHGKALFQEGNRDVPVCRDCHRAHAVKSPLTLEYHERIAEMCGRCHSDESIVGKYGLSTDVVKTYLSDFHGITLSFYKKQKEQFDQRGRAIAVCTDCHGTHNITSSVEPNANVMRQNLVKSCRKCHADAAENFPDAWLSHYKPDLRHAPLVFVINAVYRFLIPVMVVGMLLQILLHIWRYAVNR